MAQCQNPDCRKRNPLRTPWQRFCSKECRAVVRNRETQRRQLPATAVAVVDAAMAWFNGRGEWRCGESLAEACQAHKVELQRAYQNEETT